MINNIQNISDLWPNLARLTEKQREMILKILNNLEFKNTLIWTPPWSVGNIQDCFGLPFNPVSGITYRGLNSLWLSSQGYSDPRWFTENQIERAGLVFKQDIAESTQELGTQIEFSMEYDSNTKKPFNAKQDFIVQMSRLEKIDYMNNYVSHPHVTHTVYNASLLSNIVPYRVPDSELAFRNSLLEELLKNSEAPIKFVGCSTPLYDIEKDEIRLPVRSAFASQVSFYGVALHEMGHSTAHRSRLNRPITGAIGSQAYAQEELRAEFASVIIGARYGLALTDEHVANHAAYIVHWKSLIRNNPLCLFAALRDACKIAQYVEERAKTIISLAKLRGTTQLIPSKSTFTNPSYATPSKRLCMSI
ncbi:MAG: ssDNA-binding domain-containing protein [Christensenellaceae bacterium]|nr:ssDNA-binding domain-containing protein [Christensenellaceae bacterium]